MPSKFITGSSISTESLQRFEHLNLSDVYYTVPYMKLHLPENAELGIYSFESGGDQLLLPLYATPVPRELGFGDLFDFEIPYGYGGPIATTESPDFLTEAWAEFDCRCAEKNIMAGFFRFHPLLENHRFVAGNNLQILADRDTVVLDLRQPLEEIETSYAPGHKGAIKKAARLGVTIERRQDTDAMKIFHSLYHRRMEEIGAHESYRFGIEYFQNIHKFGQDRFTLYLAWVDEQPVGGALLLLGDNFAHYHLAASLGAFSKFSPSNALCARLIQDLAGGQYDYLHFGGGRTTDPKDGLFKFKAGFSSARAQFRIGKYLRDETLYNEVCARWELAYPELAQKYAAYFLRYRHSAGAA